MGWYRESPYQDGTVANFHSVESAGGIMGSHSINSFVNNVSAFKKAFVNSKGNNQKLINDFINTMQSVYGIKVTIVR